MPEMINEYKGALFSEANVNEAAWLYVALSDDPRTFQNEWRYGHAGLELVWLLKQLAARDKAQVFVLPPLKPARSFEETFSAQRAIKDHFIFDPRLL